MRGTESRFSGFLARSDLLPRLPQWLSVEARFARCSCGSRGYGGGSALAFRFRSNQSPDFPDVTPTIEVTPPRLGRGTIGSRSQAQGVKGRNVSPSPQKNARAAASECGDSGLSEAVSIIVHALGQTLAPRTTVP